MTIARIVNRLRPIIRVFVSSTFSDLKRERDALQQRVFPKLEELCLKNGFQFQAIDLRWGVSTEAGLDHRAMRICFEELRRSQEVSPEPNFLILLGNRYGWRPLPEEISQVEFDRLVSAAKSGGDRQQPIPGTHGKTAEQVLNDWYLRDANVFMPIPPVTDPERATPNYILQPRTQNLGDGRDYTRTKEPRPKDTQDWLDVQRVLWDIINAVFATEGLGTAEDFEHRFDRIDWPQHIAEVHDKQHPKRAVPQIVRFQGSATEQEIWCGALSVPKPDQHVLAFFREIESPQHLTDPQQARDFFDVAPAAGDPIPQIKLHELPPLTQLKNEIKKRLGDNAVELLPPAQLRLAPDESGQPIASVSTGHIDQLCREVETRLETIIKRQMKEYWRETEPPTTEADKQAAAEHRAARELEIERDEHFRFGRERGPKEAFVGRKDQLQRILDYVNSDSSQPLVIHGASGCGKTALLARAVDDIPAAKQPIVRFIGVTPRASDLRSLLRSLCQELRQWNPIEAAIPLDIRELIDEFRKHLQSATAERPVILFLDALDQLAESDNGRQLFWIPFGQLPRNVKIVVSCLSDRHEDDPAAQPFIALQRRKLPAENMVNLDALSPDEARTLLFDRWLPAVGRTVAKAQRLLIEQRLESKACRQPLYLKLLFEEAKLWRWYDEPTTKSSTNREREAPAEPQATELGDGVPALLEQLFDRLSQPEHHGESLVRFVLGYIAAASRGLSETEILEVLFADPDYKSELDDASQRNNHTLPTKPPRVPIALWSRLRSDLAPYLTERAAPGGNVVTLYHRQVAEWVKTRFVDQANWSMPGQDASDGNPHARLAKFFAKQDYFLESLEDQRARARRLPLTPRPSNIRKVDELPCQLLEVAKLFGTNDATSPHWDAIADLFTDLNFLESKSEAAE